MFLLISVLQFSDLMLAAQTVILFLTGVIIAWYTWETQQLRKTSVRQMELQQEQVKLTREALDRDIQAHLRESRPFFAWRGGGSGGGECYWEFENAGGQISKLLAGTNAPLDVSINPGNLLATNQKGQVRFKIQVPSQDFPPSWDFEVRYTTELGVVETQHFRASTSKQPQEL